MMLTHYMTSSKISLKNSRQASRQLRICVKSKNIVIICNSIDYLNKTYNVLTDEPLRSDSMMIGAKPENDNKQIKYFYFFKYQENNLKKKAANMGMNVLSPYDKTIQTLSHEDRII